MVLAIESSTIAPSSSAIASKSKLSTTTFLESNLLSANNFLGKNVLNAKKDNPETITTTKV